MKINVCNQKNIISFLNEKILNNNLSAKDRIEKSREFISFFIQDKSKENLKLFFNSLSKSQSNKKKKIKFFNYSQ